MYRAGLSKSMLQMTARRCGSLRVERTGIGRKGRGGLGRAWRISLLREEWIYEVILRASLAFSFCTSQVALFEWVDGWMVVNPEDRKIWGVLA